MSKYLFPNFLESDLEYKICQSYWHTKIEYFFRKNNLLNSVSYLSDTFPNGKKILTGNPIINFYNESINKAFRIIQEEPEHDTIEIGAWLNAIDTDNIKAFELVISLEMTPEAEKIALDLIEKWFVDDYSISVMEKYIDYVLCNLKLETELSKRKEFA